MKELVPKAEWAGLSDEERHARARETFETGTYDNVIYSLHSGQHFIIVKTAKGETHTRPLSRRERMRIKSNERRATR